MASKQDWLMRGKVNDQYIKDVQSGQLKCTKFRRALLSAIQYIQSISEAEPGFSSQSVINDEYNQSINNDCQVKLLNIPKTSKKSIIRPDKGKTVEQSSKILKATKAKRNLKKMNESSETRKNLKKCKNESQEKSDSLNAQPGVTSVKVCESINDLKPDEPNSFINEYLPKNNMKFTNQVTNIYPNINQQSFIPNLNLDDNCENNFSKASLENSTEHDSVHLNLDDSGVANLDHFLTNEHDLEELLNTGNLVEDDLINRSTLDLSQSSSSSSFMINSYLQNQNYIENCQENNIYNSIDLKQKINNNYYLNNNGYTTNSLNSYGSFCENLPLGVSSKDFVSTQEYNNRIQQKNQSQSHLLAHNEEEEILDDARGDHVFNDEDDDDNFKRGANNLIISNSRINRYMQ